MNTRDGSPAAPPDRVMIVGGRIGPADAPRLCERLRALVDATGATIIVCDVRTLVDPDMGTVDALARLALTGRRLGCLVRLQHAGEELREVLALAGLAAVVGLSCRLGLEREGQSEQWEHASGVEEGGQSGDLTA